MAYRIEPQTSPASELRRIALEEFDAALRRLGNPDVEGLEQSVHGARKNGKRIRAILRLARPSLGSEYRRANATVREAAALLSSLRDSHATLATFDSLLERRRDVVPEAGLDDVRHALADRAGGGGVPVGTAATLQQAAGMLATVAARVPSWKLPDDMRVIIDSAAGYHGAARAAFAAARRDPSDEQLHEWRKRVKDGWYHTQLLVSLAPSVLDPAEAVLHDLSDALGDINDLAVLRHALLASPEEFGGSQAAEAAVAIDVVRDDLIERARSLGARVYAEPEDVYADRLRRYRKAEKRFGPEVRVGSITDVYPRASTAG